MLTPEERTQRARLGALVLHSKHDSKQLTEAARAVSPGALDYWEREVDPDQQLAPVERARRAEYAKKAYFLRLAMASAKARKKSST